MRIVKVVVFSLMALLCGPVRGQVDPFTLAPDFQVSDVNGNLVHLYSLLDQGKVVVLDFYAVWCGTCQSHAPDLQDMYEELGPAGTGQIELLSLEADTVTTDSQVRLYVAFFGCTNPHVNATKNVPKLYNQIYYPTYFVVAPDRSYVLVTGNQVDIRTDLTQAVNEAPPLRSTHNDIRLRSYLQPKGSYCISAIYPELILQNYGSNTINNFNIDLRIDGELITTFVSQDSLFPYENRQDRLPWISDLQEGWHEIEFAVQSVNGVVGDDPSNDTLKGDFKIVPDGEELVIQTITDEYPKETWWQIREGGRLIAEQTRFDQPMTMQSISICVDPSGCLTLHLFDRFGDGMGGGQVLVLFRGDTLAQIKPWTFYGATIQKSFCFPGSAGINSISAESGIQINPNPASDRAWITLPETGSLPVHLLLINAIGQTVLDQIFAGQSPIELDLQPFHPGLYWVKILTDSSTFAARLLIEK